MELPRGSDFDRRYPKLSGKIDFGTSDPPTLWVEQMGNLSGMTAVGRWISRPSWGPYFLFICIWLIDVPLLEMVNYLTVEGYQVRFHPAMLLTPVGLVFIAWAIFTIDRKYDYVSNEIREYTTDEEPSYDSRLDDVLLRRWDSWIIQRFDVAVEYSQSVQPQLRRRVYTGGLIVHIAWLVFANGVQIHIFGSGNLLVGAIRWLIIAPLIYLPLAAEFISLLICIHLVLPSRVRKGGYIDFNDPLGFCGLRRVGRLIEVSALMYVGGLLLHTLVTLHPDLPGNPAHMARPEPSGVATSLIVAGTLFGFVLFFAPVYSLHRHIYTHKEQKLKKIARSVSDRSIIPPKSDIGSRPSGFDNLSERIKINQIRDTHNSPVSVEAVSRFVVSGLIPLTVEILL